MNLGGRMKGFLGLVECSGGALRMLKNPRCDLSNGFSRKSAQTFFECFFPPGQNHTVTRPPWKKHSEISKNHWRQWYNWTVITGTNDISAINSTQKTVAGLPRNENIIIPDSENKNRPKPISDYRVILWECTHRVRLVETFQSHFVSSKMAAHKKFRAENRLSSCSYL